MSNRLLAWSLAALVAVSTVAPLWAQQTSASDSSAEACPREQEKVATIVQVDHQHGLLNLETDVGRILTFASLEEVQGLHEGEQIVVCLMHEDPEESWQPDFIFS